MNPSILKFKKKQNCINKVDQWLPQPGVEECRDSLKRDRREVLGGDRKILKFELGDGCTT